MDGGNNELDFASLTEESWQNQKAKDDELIAGALRGQDPQNNGGGLAFMADFANAKIDQANKASDAIDFEDIDLSDEDMVDEPAADGIANQSFGDVPALTEDDGGTSNDLDDDLFGDENPTCSPIEPINNVIGSSPRTPVETRVEEEDSLAALRRMNGLEEGANQDPRIADVPESARELVKQAFPDFEEGKILDWNALHAPKRSTWIGKKPVKPPKPLIPTKLGLELEPDQEKVFRIPGAATVSVYQKIKNADALGLVCLEEPEAVQQAELEVFNMDDDSDSETVQGFTLRDIMTVCDDWESMINLGETVETQADVGIAVNAGSDDEAEWDRMFLDEPAPKRRKITLPRGLPEIPYFTAPNFDNFAEATAKLGKRVILDLNDPYLLIDNIESERAAKRRKVQHKMVRMSNGKMGRDLSQRFNFSSDHAYVALKENHANRVRATLATIPIEHSMPAQRLTFPYYRVKLAASDPHSYHRPQLIPRREAFQTIRFSRPGFQKRKLLKGKSVGEIFSETKDLTFNDNSTAVLFEYSEEIPTVLSNIGMGQKIINYYRRAEGSDARPERRDLGETNILQPEDRSPFAIFGDIQPGETVPALHNHMFRAPIYKHSPRETDFIVGRTSTGRDGSSWFIRNIDHLYAVGQTLPSMEVPGPHSRRVTTISKNRLKMVAYRLMSKNPRVTLSDITRHVPDSNESQNRQKLKEFLVFKKDTKDWHLPPGEVMMGEAGIRSLVKPEEVCILEATQVGAHELENGGYELGADAFKEDKDEEVIDNDKLSPDALASKMAPWRTTRAFIDASNGKAMIAVHGPGDPTGHGLGISFIRTSMKGGYLEQLHGPLATSADAIERQRKANGGHLYNVANQNTLYSSALSDIFYRQQASLEDTQVHNDDDVLAQEDEDDRFNVHDNAAATPAAADGSQASHSAASGQDRKQLKITREVKGENGEVRTVTEVVHDPVVIAQYLKKRRQIALEKIDIYNTTALPDNPEHSRLLLEVLHKEENRLMRNQERTKKRENQKKAQQRIVNGSGAGGNGEPQPLTEKGTGTTRKCANCGQVGHIKTNKKYASCPCRSKFGLASSSASEETNLTGRMY